MQGPICKNDNFHGHVSKALKHQTTKLNDSLNLPQHKKEPITQNLFFLSFSLLSLSNGKPISLKPHLSKSISMAFLLPNLHPSLLSQSKSKDKPFLLLHNNPQKPTSSHFPISLNSSYYSSQVSTTTTVQIPIAQVAQVNTPTGAASQEKNQPPKDEFYVNLGLAVRTLREDMPLIFIKDLNYDIYRDDITFKDPLNTFTGIEKYKLIFWALRFHGKILFREIALDVYRVWQPSENVILIRWNLRGVPRVPWEAKGEFQGTSRYKLDRNGKIYEHKVDNLAFNFPQAMKPASVLDLVTACPASPNPTFLWGPADDYSSSWITFYRAVRETLDKEGRSLPQDCLATCS